jgi:hypothetical protein
LLPVEQGSLSLSVAPQLALQVMGWDVAPVPDEKGNPYPSLTVPQSGWKAVVGDMLDR